MTRERKFTISRRGLFRAAGIAAAGGALAALVRRSERAPSLEFAVLKVEGEGDIEISRFDAEENRQYLYTPPEAVIARTRLEAVDVLLSDTEIRVLERDIGAAIIQERKRHFESLTSSSDGRKIHSKGPELLTRLKDFGPATQFSPIPNPTPDGNREIHSKELGSLLVRRRDLDGAAMLAARPNASFNGGALTHFMTGGWLTDIPLADCLSVEMGSRVTNADLTANGMTQPNHIAGAQKRGEIAGHEYGRHFPNRYPDEGIVKDIVLRGPPTMSAEDMVRAWLASPHHKDAMLDPNIEDMGIYAAQGVFGLSVCVMFGRHPSTNNWPVSTRSMIYKVFGPAMHKNSGNNKIKSTEEDVAKDSTFISPLPPEYPTKQP